MTDEESNVRRLTTKGSKHRTLGDFTYEKLLRLIIRGDFPESRKMPSEANLANDIGVSRPIIRQALAMLRADGLIASRQGSGSYVIRRPHHSVLDTDSDGSLADVLRCYEFRLALEGAAAALAAQRRDDRHIAEMQAALDDMYRAGDAGTIDLDADNRFHVAISRAAGNKYFESALSDIHGHIMGSMNLSLRLLRVHRPKGWEQKVLADHQNVFDAIVDRDSTRATECARRHVEAVRDSVLADTNPDTGSAEVIAQLGLLDDH